MEQIHFERIMEELHEIRKENRQIMAQIDDLNTAISAVSDDVSAIGTTVTDVQTNVATVLQDLQTAEQNGIAPDLTSAIALLQGIHSTLGTVSTSLSGVDTSLKAAIPAPAQPDNQPTS